MSTTKEKVEVEVLKGLYGAVQATNDYILRDRMNARMHKTYKITLATIIGAIPAIGSIFGYMTKLLI